MNPYDLPHDCEREEVATAMAQLDRRQRRAVRSYVRSVECGDRTLTDWIERDPDSPALSTWRKPGSEGGRYWGTEASPGEAFRQAVQLYVLAYQRWETAEEEKALRKAGRQLRMLAPKAAEQLASIIEQGQVRFDRDAQVVIKQAGVAEVLSAINSALDRAGIKTAPKSSVEMTGKDGEALMPAPDLSKLSIDDLRELHALLGKAHDADADPD